MNIILLSGGSGKRLWPLSNDIRSKQFIKMFKNGDDYESMVQRVYKQIKAVDKNANITVATSKSQVSAIHNQLGGAVGISVEPCRRDTFPAIALACVYVNEVLGVDADEPIVVCPVDPYVEDDYFEMLMQLSKEAEEGNDNLLLMGIEPDYPSEKYGYIIPESAAEKSKVLSFKEKPDKKLAEKYISEGALWNGGVFAFKLSYMLERIKALMPYTDYNDLYDRYAEMPKISFDYAVAEKERDIGVMRFHGKWMDIGTWNTLTDVMENHVVGEGVLNDSCEDVYILNELGIPILCMGLSDVVVSASPEGILVSDREQSSYIKPFVDKFEGHVMFAEKSWGSFRVLDVEKNSLTIKVTLNPGHKMNYHSHEKRDEVWVVIEGNGVTVTDNITRSVCVGDIITMKSGCKHTVSATTKLKLIEVQIGEEITVHDKIKYGDVN